MISKKWILGKNKRNLEHETFNKNSTLKIVEFQLRLPSVRLFIIENIAY